MSEQPFDPVDSYRMPLLEHLRELRHRLIVSLAAATIGCGLCFFFAYDIWDFLVAPMQLALQETGRGTMAINEPLEGVMTQLKIAGIAGLGLASPVIFYQVWRFIAPGLYPSEQRWVVPLALTSTVLFLLGAGFSYAVIFRFAFPFFLEITPESVEAVLSINSYLMMAAKMLLAFGISFQLPVAVFFLARMGLIDHRDMLHAFRYSVVAIFVIAAILTPTPDVVSQCLMAGPLIVLYGIGIGVAWAFTTKVREQLPAAPP